MRTAIALIALLALAGCDLKSTKITYSGEIDIAVADSTAPVPPPTNPPPPSTGTVEKNADLAGVKLLTADSGWYTRVDGLPQHPQSGAIITAQPVVFAPTGHRFKNDFGGAGEGIPYSVGRGNPPVPINVTAYPGESDLGPHPIPLAAPIELGPDHHLIYLDLDSGKLFELGMAAREGAGFKCEACAVWSIHKSYDQRTLGWTSADAAGLPILPGLVRYDEMKAALAKPNLADQHLGHALRFTLPNTGHGFIAPARHYASQVAYSLPGRPPMGMRIRVNPGMDLSPFNPPSQVLLRTLQLYGAVLADNGAAFFVSGTEDVRWAEYFEAITSNVNGKRGFKSFGGAEFLANIQVVDFKDTDVIKQL
jgi:hypothetical protein